MDTSSVEHRQSLLTAIIDSSEDAIISKDLNSRVTSWNKAAERIFGYTAEEMTGQLIYKLIPADRQQEEETIIARLKRGERLEHFETIRLTKDGKELQVSLTISPILDTTGHVIGASKIARDITRQKQNEMRFATLNEFARTINQKLDTDAILQAATDAATRLSGAAFGAFFYNKIDEKGQSYMLYALSGAPREAFAGFDMPGNTQVFKPTFDGTSVVRSDDITKDPRYGHNQHHGMPKGHLPVCSYLAVPVISQSGTVIGGLFLGHPKPVQFIDEHELLVVAIASQAAVALDNAKLLQEVNFLSIKKDQFIGFASHELKTPLTVLKAYLQMLQADMISKDDFFARSGKQVARLEAIITDLLDISRIRAGKLDLQKQKTALSKLIRDSAELAGVGNDRLEYNFPPEDIFVYVDPQKFSQVIVNLISNAAKYSPEDKPITISWTVIGQDAHLLIADQGIGIDASDLELIFSQFYRVSNVENKGKGIGLGLFIAREIVEAHFGAIWAESDPGKGSIFHVSIPIQHHLQ